MADSLVFDFPDATPRFDFDIDNNGGSGNAPSSPTKKAMGKKSRAAIFKNRFGSKRSSSPAASNRQTPLSSSPLPSPHGSPLNKSMGESSGATTATTASMSVGSGSYGTPNRGGNNSYVDNGGGGIINNNSSPSTFEFSLWDDTSPKSSGGLKKSLLSSKPNPYATHQRNFSGDHQFNMSSDRTAASGYISEVSEFSFDRVTVTTDRTGMSSNVSWNFLENVGLSDRQNPPTLAGVLDELAPGAAAGRGAASITKQSLQHPPDIDKLLLDEDLPHSSSGRVDVYTGEIRCDQSIISEISEGVYENDDSNQESGTDAMEFINTLLMEKYNDNDKMEASGKKVVSTPQRPSTTTQLPGNIHRKKNIAPPGGISNNMGAVLTGASSSVATGSAAAATCGLSTKRGNHTVSTVESSATADGNNSGVFSKVETAYDKYKRFRNKGYAENRSILQAIIEDIQFCGMYFCGIDTSIDDDGQLTDERNANVINEIKTLSKEERMKEMDDTFLGKFIKCEPCGADTTTVSDCNPTSHENM